MSARPRSRVFSLDPVLPLRRRPFPHQPGQNPLQELAAGGVVQAAGAVGGDGFQGRRGTGVAVPPAPAEKYGTVAQVGAPGVFRRELDRALRTRSASPAASDGASSVCRCLARQ